MKGVGLSSLMWEVLNVDVCEIAGIPIPLGNANLRTILRLRNSIILSVNSFPECLGFDKVGYRKFSSEYEFPKMEPRIA